MPHRGALERLHEYQAEALELIGRAEAVLADADERDVAALARIRWALVRTLTAYQLFKHNEIFDPGLAKGASATTLRLARMKRACTEMGDAFRVHVQTWSAIDTGAQWTAYRTAARAMSAQLRAHIARERDEVGGYLATLERESRPVGAVVTRPPAAVPPPPGRPTPAG